MASVPVRGTLTPRGHPRTPEVPRGPQGPDNAPVQIGDRAYDNGRHKVWDTYFIPTLSVGYSW